MNGNVQYLQDNKLSAAETGNREAERSTCQTGFKGVEVGHTPGVKTADRDNFPSLPLCSALCGTFDYRL